MAAVEPNREELLARVARLEAELDACEAATRAAEAELGERRGQLAEMSVQLGRARQAQEWAETGGPSSAERASQWWSRGAEGAREFAGRARRALRPRESD